jgi:hypothetical protein
MTGAQAHGQRHRWAGVSLLAAALVLGACQRAPDPAADAAAADTTPRLELPAPATPVELSGPIRTFVDSIRSAEARRLASVQDRAHRASVDRLWIVPTDAEPLAYDDILERNEVMRLHVFRGRLPQGFLLVEVVLMEGGQFLLIDERTGAELDIDGVPIVSPDGSRFATASLDLVAGHVPNRLAVYRFTPDGIEREWVHEPRGWGPSEVEWLDATTLRFQRNTIDLDTAPHTVSQIGATARLGEAGWRLDD